MARALGINDAVTTCDCCGKHPLKSTVEIELDDGTVVHYGSVCAKRNTGKSQPTISAEIRDYAAAQLVAAKRAFYATPEATAEIAAFQSRPRELMGKEASAWVRDSVEAADRVRSTIAAQFNVRVWALRM